MTKGKQIIRMNDPDAKRQLNVLAARENKTQGEITAELIREKYATVFSIPRNDVTVAEAIQTVEA
jgi:hypothetical protein